MITSAKINFRKLQVGNIFWDQETQLAFFEYDPEFLSQGIELSPIKMPLKDGYNQVFRFPELRQGTTFLGMPGLVADALPDKFGNTLINAWLVQQGRPAESLNPVERLCFIGERAMGALSFSPLLYSKTTNPTKIEVGAMVEIVELINNKRQAFASNLQPEEEQGIKDLIMIGTSAGGARAKAVIAFNPETQEVRSGQVDAPEGFSHWLIKFDGVQDTQLGGSNGFGRVELAYYHMAQQAGIDMMPCQLFEENGRAHFMTQRFDRGTHNQKFHYQSLCALQHWDFNQIASYSYEQVFQTLNALKLSYNEAEQLFRRMVFNVLAQNCDDHTKNFGFLYHPATRKWKLAPAFDVSFAYNPTGITASQHALSVNGKRQKSQITSADFLAVAKYAGIKKAQSIITQITEVVNNWPSYAEKTQVPPKLSQHIKSCLGLS